MPNGKAPPSTSLTVSLRSLNNKTRRRRTIRCCPTRAAVFANFSGLRQPATLQMQSRWVVVPAGVRQRHPQGSVPADKANHTKRAGRWQGRHAFGKQTKAKRAARRSAPTVSGICHGSGDRFCRAARRSAPTVWGICHVSDDRFPVGPDRWAGRANEIDRRAGRHLPASPRPHPPLARNKLEKKRGREDQSGMSRVTSYGAGASATAGGVRDWRVIALMSSMAISLASEWKP